MSALNHSSIVQKEHNCAEWVSQNLTGGRLPIYLARNRVVAHSVLTSFWPLLRSDGRLRDQTDERDCCHHTHDRYQIEDNLKTRAEGCKGGAERHHTEQHYWLERGATAMEQARKLPADSLS